MSKCYECKGQDFERRTVDTVTRVGEHKVSDKSVTCDVCVNCGAYTLTAKELELVELRAAVVLLSDVKPVTGAILKFARKALGLTQVALGERIDAASETISRWEKGSAQLKPWVALVIGKLVQDRLHPTPPEVSLLKRAS